MIKNYLLIAIRNMSRNKVFSLINLLGLSLGIAVTLVVSNFVIQENSFDKFHENGDKIYRVNVESFSSYTKTTNTMSLLPVLLAGEIEANIPNIDKVLKLKGRNYQTLKHGDDEFDRLSVAYFDSTFFNFFSYELTLGNPKTALLDLNAIVLTSEMSTRIFGSDNPMGQIILNEEGKPLKVTGVLAAAKGRSHFKFDYIIPFHVHFSTLTEGFLNWGSKNTNIYLQLSAEANIEEIETSINEIYHNALGESHLKRMSRPSCFLQPLTEVYLDSEDMNLLSIEIKGEPEKVKMFTLIAIMVLILACANFINLSTAVHTKRAREVGLRKVIGANKKQLIMQFLLESTLMALLAGMFSVLLADLMVVKFDEMVNRDFATGFFDISLAAVLMLTVLITGVLAGLYPAFYLSSFQPDRILRAKGKGTKYTLRNVLFVSQFSLATVFILVTLFINKQLSYMESFDHGFDTDELYYVNMSSESVSERDVVRNEMLKSPVFAEIAYVDNLPFLGGGTASYVDLEDGSRSESIHLYRASANAIGTLGMSIVAGRDFREGEPLANILINETLAKVLGGTDAMGTSVHFMGVDGQVVGIIKDFHRTSLHTKVQPIVWRPENLSKDLERGTYIVGRINNQRFSEASTVVETAVSGYRESDKYLRHGFFGTASGRYYSEEENLSNAFTYTSTFAIVISCLGLLGLMSFAVSSRAKEVGVRKVLGASIGTIVKLLSYSFAKLILLSLIISVPLAFLYVSDWLSNFVYHTNLEAFDFIRGGMLIIFISVLTILYQLIRASRTNPVDSLKYE